MHSHSQIVKNISACVSEDGDIRDSASDEVRQSRGKLRAIENRLKAILKGHSGEVSEMVRVPIVRLLTIAWGAVQYAYCP